MNVKDYEGKTALLYAASGGHDDACKYLISEGANVNHRNNNGQTALMLARKNGHDEVSKLLISRGAK